MKTSLDLFPNQQSLGPEGVCTATASSCRLAPSLPSLLEQDDDPKTGPTKPSNEPNAAEDEDGSGIGSGFRV